MTAGRRPKPTALKLLAGNPGKRPLNTNEPEPDALDANTPPPEHLSEEAKTEWRRILPLLIASSVATVLDIPPIAAYCQAWARWVEAEGFVAQQGVVIETKHGAPTQNPYLSVANKAMEQMFRFLTELGMSPASRTRVQVKKAKRANPFSSLPGGKSA